MTASSPTSSLHTLTVRVQLALDRFDLDIDVTTHQQVTGIFGVSGSGKTSLLETICGLRRNAQGTIRFGEEVWLDTTTRTFVKPEQRHIGYVPQDGLLFPRKNVRQNLLSGSKRAVQNGHPLQETLQLVTDILELSPPPRPECDDIVWWRASAGSLGPSNLLGPTFVAARRTVCVA